MSLSSELIDHGKCYTWSQVCSLAILGHDGRENIVGRLKDQCVSFPLYGSTIEIGVSDTGSISIWDSLVI